MTQPTVVPLSAVWPTFGIPNLPTWILVCLHEAWREPLIPPGGTPPVIEELFKVKIQRWTGTGEIAAPSSGVWRRICLLGVEPVPRGQIFDHIYVNLDTQSFDHQEVTEVVWGTEYERFATSVFWAQLFHTPDVYLAHPERLLHQVYRAASRSVFLNLDVHPTIKKEADHGLNLALLERVIGAQYDEAKEVDHYVRLIRNNPYMGADRRAERPELFHHALLYLRHTLEAELAQ